MKKIILAVLVLVLAVSMASAAAPASGLSDGNVSLGQDHVKMTWYLVGYGKIAATGDYAAIVRKYYTNQGIKNETVELLMSKFGLDAEKAASLYFTEYEYLYAKDLKSFGVGYVRHYDMVGHEVHGTVYDNSADDKKQTWVATQPKGPSGLAVDKIRQLEKIPEPKPAKPAPKKK